MIQKKNPEIEISRSSGLYFAIGLNVMLFLSWQLLEFKTYDIEDVDIGVLSMDSEVEEDIPIININTPPPPPPPPPVATVENIKVVEDEVVVEETFIESTETDQDEKIKEPVVSVSDIYVEGVEEDVEVPFAVIEEVPIFPGCEKGTRAEIKACFQRKIQEHIVKHFVYPEPALNMEIEGRVSVIFVIDTNGQVTGLRSRGPDKILENEAERILGLLPQMKPGMQRGKPVKVAYSVPILFRMN
ncbi:energy transducer TonB [Pseudalgibacter alginicilyticus]|uniref:Energy transducer TonB n=1 Tax=Pseudalgibacter alginicilyticus TaxID=1736674 RepID=A0A0P0CIV2_9FLAO|nr:energy transducer TonB [Pseudalgibacter alginicilyticus]ALJ06144.1 energy transducer TonB [Pseudalgibacter alginicilyticus]